MASFRRMVRQATSGFCDKHRFRADVTAELQDFLALVRRETRRVCSYVLLRDDRRGGGSVRCDFWIAPVDSPDDGLEKLGIGYKVLIGETWETPEAHLPGFMRRVETMLPSIQGLVVATEAELQCPPLQTKRFTIYCQELRIFDLFMQEAAAHVANIRMELIEKASLNVAGKMPTTNFLRACTDAATKLLETRWLEGVMSPAPHCDIVAGALSSQLHMWILVPPQDSAESAPGFG